MNYRAANDSGQLPTSTVTLAGQAAYTVHIDTDTEAGRKVAEAEPYANEDSASVRHLESRLFAAVFDGATSETAGLTFEGETVSGARYVSRFLAAGLRDTDTYQTPADLVIRLNEALLVRLGELGFDLADLNARPTSTATVVGIDAVAKVIEIAHVGDSFVIAEMTDGSTELLTNNLHRRFDEEIFEYIAQVAKTENITHREAKPRPEVLAKLRAILQDSRNRPDGTGEGIINGDPTMAKYLYTKTVPLSSVRTLFIASDGMVPPGWDERKAEDRQRFFDILHRDGVRGVIERARQIEDADPDWHQVRYKHSDDATGIFLQIQRDI